MLYSESLWLIAVYIVIYICESRTSNLYLQPPALSHLVIISLFSTSVSLFCMDSFALIFRFYIYVIQYEFVFLWLTLFSMIFYGLIHAPAICNFLNEMAKFHSFLWLTIPLCIWLLRQSAVDWRLGCFHVLAIVSSAAINIGVHVSFQIIVFFFSRHSGGSNGKEPACQCIRDMGLISGSGRSPGGGDGPPLQYSCLENPMSRGTWGATVHGATESSKTGPT